MAFGGALALDAVGCCEGGTSCIPCAIPDSDLTLLFGYFNVYGLGGSSPASATLTLSRRTGTASGSMSTDAFNASPYWYSGKFTLPDFCLTNLSDCPPYDTYEHAVLFGCVSSQIVLMHLTGPNLDCVSDDGSNLSWTPPSIDPITGETVSGSCPERWCYRVPAGITSYTCDPFVIDWNPGTICDLIGNRHRVSA